LTLLLVTVFVTNSAERRREFGERTKGGFQYGGQARPNSGGEEYKKRLDRLTLAEYSIDASNEAFTIDDLGNRDSVNVRDGNEKDKIGNYNWWLSLVSLVSRKTSRRRVIANV
jgi:hypothetical protein